MESMAGKSGAGLHINTTAWIFHSSRIFNWAWNICDVLELKALALEPTNCRVRGPQATLRRYDFVTHFSNLHHWLSKGWPYRSYRLLSRSCNTVWDTLVVEIRWSVIRYGYYEILWWACLFVCPFTYLRNQTAKLHHLFYARWSWKTGSGWWQKIPKETTENKRCIILVIGYAMLSWYSVPLLNNSRKFWLIFPNRAFNV